MENLRPYFEYQISYTKTISDFELEQIQYRRVYSGTMIENGDKVLYAFINIKPNEKDENLNNIKMISLLEREIENLSKQFKFYDWYNDAIPILTKK